MSRCCTLFLLVLLVVGLSSCVCHTSASLMDSCTYRSFEPEKRVRRFLLMRRLKIDELYAFNKSEFVGNHCRSTGLQSRLEAP